MIALEIMAWSAIAATLAWGVTLRHASAMIRQLRAEASAEIQRTRAETARSRAETARARVRAAQLERELASWTEGCRQGREDVMALMPLLLARSDPARTASPGPEQETRSWQ
jgi:hypothetical protein